MWEKLKVFIARIFTKQAEIDYFREASITNKTTL